MPATVNSAALQDVVALADVAVRTTTLTGTGVDLQPYEGLVRITLQGLRTTGDLLPTIEDSADNSTGWATVPAGALSAAFTAVAAGTAFIQTVVLKKDNVRRYVRLIGTASNTPSHAYGAVLSAQKKYRP